MKTLANLTGLRPGMVDGIRRVAKGGVVLEQPDEAFQIRHSLAHGHVVALPGLYRQSGLPRILQRLHCRERDLAMAAIVARVLSPDSRLATERQHSPATASSSPGAVPGLGPVSGNEMRAMPDWLRQRQA